MSADVQQQDADATPPASPTVASGSSAETSSPLSSFVGQPWAPTDPLQTYSITAEYRLLAKQNIPGVYANVRDNQLEWDVVLFLREGTYEGAVVKARLQLPPDFPSQTPPRLRVLTPIFHPQVDDLGFVQTRSDLRQWDVQQHRVWQVLEDAQHRLSTDETQDACNTTAAELLQSGRVEEFRSKAFDCLKELDMQTYATEEDDFSIRLSRWREDTHSDSLQNMKAEKTGVPGPAVRGYSWVSDVAQPAPLTRQDCRH